MEPQTLADPVSFRIAYEEHHAAMVGIAGGVLRDAAAAEDVVHDIFLDLWRSPHAFDRRRGTLRGYLTMLAKHRSLDRWRSRAVAKTAAERAQAQAAIGTIIADGPVEQVLRTETAREVRAAVDALPTAQREAILLTYGSGLSTPELATVTGAPLGTAKGRVRLGLMAARKTLAVAA